VGAGLPGPDGGAAGLIATPVFQLDSVNGVVYFEDSGGLQIEVYKYVRHRRGPHPSNPAVTATTDVDASLVALAPSTPLDITWTVENQDDDGLITVPSTTFTLTGTGDHQIDGTVVWGGVDPTGTRDIDIIHNGSSVYNVSVAGSGATAQLQAFSFNLVGAGPGDTIQIRVTHTGAGPLNVSTTGVNTIVRTVTPGVTYPDRLGKRFRPLYQLPNGATSWAIPDRWYLVNGVGLPIGRARKRTHFRFGYRDVTTGARGPLTPDLVSTSVRFEMLGTAGGGPRKALLNTKGLHKIP
jgi:hypothetical protein